MKILAIIQARMGSERLPGKVVELIDGKPMLQHVVERTKRCGLIDEVAIATTINPSDQPIADLCNSQDWKLFRGSEHDVLDRYYQAASFYNAQLIVRITSDCPLIDPDWITRVIDPIRSSDLLVDYCSNVFPTRTLPRGLDVEVVTMSTLRRLWVNCKSPRLKEHVTLAVREKPEDYRIHSVNHSEDLSAFRWTVDTLDDLNLIRQVFEHFGQNDFDWRQVRELMKVRPELSLINQHVQQKAA